MTAATFTDWLTSIGTVGAFLTGGILLARELRRDQEREENAKRAQAQRVSAWCEGTDGNNTRLVAVNNSDLPIFDVVVITNEPSSGTLANYDMGMVAGKEKSEQLAGVSKDPVSRQARPVPVCFYDSSGNRWVRDGLGLLYPGSKANLDKMDENGIIGGIDQAQSYYDLASEKGEKTS